MSYTVLSRPASFCSVTVVMLVKSGISSFDGLGGYVGIAFLCGLFLETDLFLVGGGGAIFRWILSGSGVSCLSSDDLLVAGVGLREPKAALFKLFVWVTRRILGRVADGFDC